MIYCECGNVVENRETGRCASCAHAVRKAAKVKQKIVQPVKKVSEKEAKRLIEYSKLQKEYLAAHLICQAKIKDVCTGIANQVHHTAKRIGDNLLDVESFLAVCPDCHVAIETMLSASERREKGFLK